MSDKSVFYKRMPGGIAGQVTREEMAKKEPQMMSPTAPPLFYGIPVKMDGNGKITFITGAGDKIRGFLTRPYPVQEESINYEGFSMGQPSVKQPCDILRSGYMMVQCLAGTPVLDGQVYVRWGTDSGTQGTIEAVTSGNQVAITGAYFLGGADADGNVEIVYNI